MRALIFNSGLGSRLGELTHDRPKCLVTLSTGETFFHRQLRILESCGVRDVVVTTGPFPELVKAETSAFAARGMSFTFVPNTRYAETNYIYSMWLAREELYGHDILLLHGDLVFDAAYVQAMLDDPRPSLGSVNEALPQPEKDFKARVIDGEVREVSVKIFDEDCVAFQALYKLSAESLGIWLDEVNRFVERGETGVYAENAANNVYAQMHVKAFSYARHVAEEIDTPEDRARVSAMIAARDFADQPVFELEGGSANLVEGHVTGAMRDATSLPEIMAALGMERPLVVADAFFASQIGTLLGGTLAAYPRFSGYAPNPTYEQVLAGIRAFRENGCDGVVSLGGGSAIDVAKCIRLWACLPGDEAEPRLTELDAGYPSIPQLAIPTTAGTGSESTHFAVIYVDGSKVSVSRLSAQPNAAVLAPELLAGLPDYQRKATLLDALCQAIESYWSHKSDEESRAYSMRAIPLILENVDAYLAGDARAAREVMIAANLAGKAINLTTTTAPHAMSYKITSQYGDAHGHAVGLCMPVCWKALLDGATEETMLRLSEIDQLMTGACCEPWGAGLAAFRKLYESFGLTDPHEADEAVLDMLAASVNVQRLSNFPLALTKEQLREMYGEILR